MDARDYSSVAFWARAIKTIPFVVSGITRYGSHFRFGLPAVLLFSLLTPPLEGFSLVGTPLAQRLIAERLGPLQGYI